MGSESGVRCFPVKRGAVPAGEGSRGLRPRGAGLGSGRALRTTGPAGEPGEGSGLPPRQTQVDRRTPLSARSSLPSTQVHPAAAEIHEQSSTAPPHAPSIPPPAPPPGLLVKRA